MTTGTEREKLIAFGRLLRREANALKKRSLSLRKPHHAPKYSNQVHPSRPCKCSECTEYNLLIQSVNRIGALAGEYPLSSGKRYTITSTMPDADQAYYLMEHDGSGWRTIDEFKSQEAADEALASLMAQGDPL